MTVALPRITSRDTDRLDDYVQQLSKLTRVAYVYAISSGKIHRIRFIIKDSVHIQIEKQQGYSVKGEPVFAPVVQSFVPTSYTVDHRIALQHFFVKGIDEVARGKLEEVWFYIFPMGLTQDIIITIQDRETGDERSLVLNPFSVKFTAYDTVQTP